MATQINIDINTAAGQTKAANLVHNFRDNSEGYIWIILRDLTIPYETWINAQWEQIRTNPEYQVVEADLQMIREALEADYIAGLDAQKAKAEANPNSESWEFPTQNDYDMATLVAVSLTPIAKWITESK
jgi:hypothetical protein